MPNTPQSDIISISLPRQLSQAADKSAKKLRTSKSRLFQDALKQYLWLLKWQEVQGYGVEQARVQGILPENVPQLINEYRQEKTSN